MQIFGIISHFKYFAFLQLFFLLFQLCSSSDKPSSTILSLTKRRLLSEWKEIVKEGLTMESPFNITSANECGVRLSPVGKNFLHWHFSFTGVANSSFAEGCYHGQIVLPKEYPRKAPSICVITPNGRWEIGKDICLSASNYHQETWNMKWNLRTLVMALRGHMLTQPREIGGISTPPDTQRLLAKQSRFYGCRLCGSFHPFLLGDVNDSQRSDLMKFQISSRSLAQKTRSHAPKMLKPTQGIIKWLDGALMREIWRRLTLGLPFLVAIHYYIRPDIPIQGYAFLAAFIVAMSFCVTY